MAQDPNIKIQINTKADTSGADKAKAAVDDLNKSVDQTTESSKQAGTALVDASQEMTTGTDSAVTKTATLRQAVNNLTDKIKGYGKTAREENQSVASSLKTLMTGWRAAATMVSGLFGALGLGNRIIETGRQLWERYNKARNDAIERNKKIVEEESQALKTRNEEYQTFLNQQKNETFTSRISGIIKQESELLKKRNDLIKAGLDWQMRYEEHQLKMQGNDLELERVRAERQLIMGDIDQDQYDTIVDQLSAKKNEAERQQTLRQAEAVLEGFTDAFNAADAARLAAQTLIDNLRSAPLPTVSEYRSNTLNTQLSAGNLSRNHAEINAILNNVGWQGDHSQASNAELIRMLNNAAAISARNGNQDQFDQANDLLSWVRETRSVQQSRLSGLKEERGDWNRELASRNLAQDETGISAFWGQVTNAEEKLKEYAEAVNQAREAVDKSAADLSDLRTRTDQERAIDQESMENRSTARDQERDRREALKNLTEREEENTKKLKDKTEALKVAEEAQERAKRAILEGAAALENFGQAGQRALSKAKEIISDGVDEAERQELTQARDKLQSRQRAGQSSAVDREILALVNDILSNEALAAANDSLLLTEVQELRKEQDTIKREFQKFRSRERNN